MSIQSQRRLYSQQRLTVPTIRSIDSSVSADFDAVLRGLITSTTPYVITGLTLNINSNAFSATADNLTLNSLNSAVLHSSATESGTMLNVSGFSAELLNSTNTRVVGGFSPGVTNYVCLDLIREADSTSTDTVYFWDDDAQTEFTKLLPVSTILDYQIIINTSGFGTYLPIATVVTNSANVATAITDCRQMLFRLGTGGVSPNPNYNYPWSAGRLENPSTSSSSGVNPFIGGDKQLTNFKDWIAAVETSIKEVKGTAFWYSSGSSGGGGSTTGLSLFSVAEDGLFGFWNGTGAFTHSASVTGQLSWNSDFYVDSVFSNQFYKIQTNPSGTVLANNQTMYVSLNRYTAVPGTVTIGPALGPIPSSVTTDAGNNSLAIIQVSAGQLTGLTSNAGSDIGDFIKVIDDSPQYYAQISNFYDAAGSLTTGANAIYATLTAAYGGSIGSQTIQYDQTYYTTGSVSVTTTANVLNGTTLGQLYWIAVRKDGSAPLMYLRNWGQLIAGETRNIANNISQNTLQFIGSTVASVPNQAVSVPLYASSISGSVTSPSQVNYGGTSADNLTTRTSLLTTAAADQAQNKNIVFLGGGVASNSGGTLTWTSSITVIVAGPGVGSINSIAASSAAIPSSASFGGCAYVTINRNTANSVLAVSVTTNDLLPLGENIFVFARRMPSSSDVYTGSNGASLLLSDGTSNSTGINPSNAASSGIGNIHKWTQEVPAGSINSSNTSFTLTFVPHSGAGVLLFRNGLLQRQNGASPDYSIASSTITFTSAPITGNEIVALYPPTQKTINYSYAQEIPTGTINGSNTSFTISQAIGNARGVAVFLNGLQRRYTSDFTITGTNIVFTFAPTAGSTVYIWYTTSNDTLFGDQNNLGGTPNGTKTLFTYFEDIESWNSVLVSVNGVGQWPVKNTAGSTAWTIVDYQFLDPNGLLFNATGWGGSAPATSSLLYLWSR